MIEKVAGIGSISPIKNQTVSSVSKSFNKGEFDGILKNAIKDVATAEKTNMETIQKVAAGDISNLNQALVSIVETDLTLQFTMQVRNKIVDAYKEIMGMQV